MSVAPSILLVDDDNDLLEMVCMALQAQKLNVSCLNDGEQVLNALETTKPDLILMDIYLGNSDGRDICYKIKTTPEHTEIPVILYSAGNIQPQSIDESRANLFIKKPFELSYLFQTIKSLTQQNSEST